ncbi:MAG TPA: NADP-dependent glyceraldehyde-3-phosphate dehydrogenase [Hydrogenophaga sp.]|uniref:NADP-dependent glyceraldehyde-3-phosphate dehydrogenase n=1 Tax=Hydrogenophaga sp. TaxID=1904254 RepID=UPI002CF40BC0|nr:NADP-dependent glyceraldehyde-3-phosphate dehydrogenase [Hydrogenophaga sp.]HMN94740.1 NADP-dependent glyceraldehyde-3-phosphate dehydrogenase [Hydrogenophaga sp.]HMP09725.1 NADP-dependent glyceraldehyde-3-phosphate dehydrogenase [Hydrogenophaga sp.]
MTKPLFPSEHDIPLAHRVAEPIEQEHYLCNGALKVWAGPRQEVWSPVWVATPDGLVQKRVGSYPLLDEPSALQVLDAACTAWDRGCGVWPTLSVEERIRHVEAFTHRMTEQRDEVVRLLMWEIGKTLPDARKEFDRTIDYIRDTIDALKDMDRGASRLVIEEGVIGQIRRAPLGVVLCMGPFNYPLNETFTTLIPALIMGNVVIFKPPKLGVLLHRPLLQALADAFPKGVINTVYGDGQQVVGPLMASGRVDVLAFIGSSRVADLLKQQHPRPHRLRCVLGLEAKNAGIVLPDADLDLAVKECVLGALSYNGQRCTALKILFVHRSVLDDFLARLVESVGRLRPGMPWEEGVSITPLPEPDKTTHLSALIEDAVSRGARVVNPGGGRVERTFMSPAIVCPVGPGMRLYTEEQFGPVVPVVPFDDLNEPMEYVIASAYGQQVSLFGTDAQTLARLIDPLVNQVCRVNINSQCQRGPDSFPFTGRKASAEGTLSVRDALEVFSLPTLVASKDSEGNKRIIRAIVTGRHSRFLSTDFLL